MSGTRCRIANESAVANLIDSDGDGSGLTRLQQRRTSHEAPEAADRSPALHCLGDAGVGTVANATAPAIVPRPSIVRRNEDVLASRARPSGRADRPLPGCAACAGAGRLDVSDRSRLRRSLDRGQPWPQGHGTRGSAADSTLGSGGQVSDGFAAGAADDEPEAR